MRTDETSTSRYAAGTPSSELRATSMPQLPPQARIRWGRGGGEDDRILVAPRSCRPRSQRPPSPGEGHAEAITEQRVDG